MNQAESPRLPVVPDEPNDIVPDEVGIIHSTETDPLSTEIVETETKAGTTGDELLNHVEDPSSEDKQFQIAPPNNSEWGDDPLQSNLNQNGQPEE